MAPLLQYVALVLAAAVSYLIGRAVLSAIRQSGADASTADHAKEDAAIARAQSEILAERKDAEDVARDLDSGRF